MTVYPSVVENDAAFRHIFPSGTEDGHHVKIDQLKYLTISFPCECKSGIITRLRHIFPQLLTLKHCGPWWRQENCHWDAPQPPQNCCEHRQTAGHSFVRGSPPFRSYGCCTHECFYALDTSPEVNHFFKFTDRNGQFPP